MKRPMFFCEGETGGATGGGAAGGGAPAAGAAGNTLLSGTTAADTGAGTGATAPAPWIKDDGSFSGDWLAKLPEDLRGHASLKVIQSLPDLAKSYVSTKALVGKRLEMPGEGATPEQLAEFRKVTGAPEKPEGYLGDAKTLRPDTVPENAWDAEAEKGFLTLAHKYHLPPAAVKEIVAFHGEHLAGAMKASQVAEAEVLKGESTKLHTAWGKDFDTNMITAARVAQTVGLDPKTHPIFASAEVVQAFSRIGKLMSEDKLIKGDQGSPMAATIGDRIRDMTDSKSSSVLAREYRGEFGPERQTAAQRQLHELYGAQKQAA